MTVVIADRTDPSKSRSVRLPAERVFHTVNAFEDGKSLVIDYVGYPDDEVSEDLASILERPSPDQCSGNLRRVRIHDDGTVEQTTIATEVGELPRVNPNFDQRDYRYAYTAQFEGPGFGTSELLRIDVATGEKSVVDLGPGCTVGEPVFVPRPGSTDEDDGVILSIVYDEATDRSCLALVDGKSFDQGPMAKIHLPIALPFGFHGSVIPPCEAG